MAKALFVIDYQYDFVSSDGLLSCGENAQAIDQTLAENIRSKRALGYDIIFTLDTHDLNNYPNSAEGAKFPIHCVKGTKGHGLYGLTAKECLPGDLIIEKDTFGYSDMDKLPDYDEVEFCGVAGHVCVLQNILMYYNTHPKAKLIVRSDCVGDFDMEFLNFAYEYMRRVIGVSVISGEF